jgi:hypothetical protein
MAAFQCSTPAPARPKITRFVENFGSWRASGQETDAFRLKRKRKKKGISVKKFLVFRQLEGALPRKN